ncbi:MAG: glycoside hydrolase family 26 protein [Paludibacteraceae bacterium]|nr:glycoside hydrolase family 26 protein [Paludibacteraceae bacterium]
MIRNILFEKGRLPFLMILLIGILTACKPSVNDPTSTELARVLSLSIVENQEITVGITSELTISFFQNITIVHPEQITLNDLPAKATISNNDKHQLVVDLSNLEYGTHYTFHLAEGALSADYEGVPRPSVDVLLHFSTKEKRTMITQLCNPDAIPAAQNVFNFLLEQYGKKILSSTIANVNWNFAEAELVYQATGKYPAIATMDYIHMFTLTSHNPFKGWTVPYNDTRDVERWWANNGLIAAGWHWNMPANEDAINDTNGYTCTPGSGTVSSNGTTTCAKPSNIMKEGTWEKRIADEDLAKMAELLLLLQDKGIPVIWRPFHEASGNTYGQWAGGGAWFWWGIEGAEAYKALWRYTFDYFHQAGVNNLIWVWTSQNNGDNDWYPGDEYVDIIGQDIYNKSASSNAEDFTRLQATYPHKLVTLSECGNVGKISEQWAAGAYWSYFMPWYQYDAKTLDGHQHANTAWWQDAMQCPVVISRDQMPSLK